MLHCVYPALVDVTILYDCAPVKNCALSNVTVPPIASNAYPLVPPLLVVLTVAPFVPPSALLYRQNTPPTGRMADGELTMSMTTAVADTSLA
jgi:hypothetical protein